MPSTNICVSVRSGLAGADGGTFEELMVSIDRVEPGCVIAAHVEAVDNQDWILDTMDGIGESWSSRSSILSSQT